jgi:phosphate transport system ATP-binding protein
MSTQADPAQSGEGGGPAASLATPAVPPLAVPGPAVPVSAVPVPAVATSTLTPGSAPAGKDAVAIATVDLTLSFGQRAILSGISTEVHRGKVTALIGPTGSGKTTLLRTFNRMNDKVTGYRHSGDVLLDGRSIWHPGVELLALRRKVGMLFQRPNPFPMSILENVTAGTRAHKMVSRADLRTVAEENLTAVGLWGAVKDRLKDSPFRLSGGQQQLLCLARALAIKPEVLLLDEPTSALDPNATESIEALIRALVPGLTVIIVTHNIAQAARIADRTMFLNQGRLVEHGETRQMFENPHNEETAHYVGGRFG